MPKKKSNNDNLLNSEASGIKVTYVDPSDKNARIKHDPVESFKRDLDEIERKRSIDRENVNYNSGNIDINELKHTNIISITNNERSKAPKPKLNKLQPLKRIYRRANDLPDTSKPREAAVNRTKARITIAISEQLLAQVERVAEAKGVDRSEWFAEAFEEYFLTSPDTVPADFPDFRKSETIGIWLPPSLAADVKAAAKKSSLSTSKWIHRVSHAASVPSVENGLDHTPH